MDEKLVRAAAFRQKALEAEERAKHATTAEVKRAWTIVARDWRQMADREEERL